MGAWKAAFDVMSANKRAGLKCVIREILIVLRLNSKELHELKKRSLKDKK